MSQECYWVVITAGRCPGDKGKLAVVAETLTSAKTVSLPSSGVDREDNSHLSGREDSIIETTITIE